MSKIKVLKYLRAKQDGSHGINAVIALAIADERWGDAWDWLMEKRPMPHKVDPPHGGRLVYDKATRSIREETSGRAVIRNVPEE